jgi:hypothetical protein
MTVIEDIKYFTLHVFRIYLCTNYICLLDSTSNLNDTKGLHDSHIVILHSKKRRKKTEILQYILPRLIIMYHFNALY